MDTKRSFLGFTIPIILFIIIGSFGLISCDKDETITEKQDFSIRSTESFEVMSTHENGWIKEAMIKDFSGEIIASFEYHSNGYIKKCQKYGYIPTNHLLVEIERDENNLPVSSKYFSPNGHLYLNIDFDDGRISSKFIELNDIETTFSYENGQVIRIAKWNKALNESTTIMYNYEQDTRLITLEKDGDEIFSRVAPFIEDGYGVSTEDDVMLNSFIKDYDIIETKLSQVFSSSIGWRSDVDPTDIVPIPVDYNIWFGRDSMPIDLVKFINNSVFFQNIIEQYPLVEDGALISGFYSIDTQFRILPFFDVILEINEKLDEDLNAFTRLYGNEFNETYSTGKYMMVIGTLRNLPTDFSLRNQIKDIAFRKALLLTTGSLSTDSGDEINSLPEADETLLSNIFFELKMHSPFLENDHGEVIDSHDKYLDLIEIINNSEDTIIQRGFKSYQFL